MNSYLRALWLLIKERLRRFYNPVVYRDLVNSANERETFYSAIIKPGDLIFDVGANLGNRTGCFLKLGAKVIALEPQSFCFNYLRLKYGSRVKVFRCAAGSKPGRISLQLNSASSTIASMSTEWISAMRQGRFRQTNWNRSEMVNVVTLDSLIDSHGVPAFIKIDVEGFEPEVIKGLTKPVSWISFEYTTPEMREHLLECLRLINLLSASYEFNFSIGETNRMALEKWLSYEQITERVLQDLDSLGGFGDIYARLSGR
jgi:FkbM family methyltransferase